MKTRLAVSAIFLLMMGSCKSYYSCPTYAQESDEKVEITDQAPEKGLAKP